MKPLPPDEAELELMAIRHDLEGFVKRRLRAKQLENDTIHGNTRSGVPLAPVAFTRVLERSIVMSPRRHQPKHGTRLNVGTSFSPNKGSATHDRSASSPPRNPHSPFAPSTPPARSPMTRQQGRHLRPKSAPANSRPTSGLQRPSTAGSSRSHTIDELLDNDEALLSGVFGEHISPTNWDTPDVLGNPHRRIMQRVGSAGRQESVAEEVLEKILAFLRSRDRENQMKGIEMLDAVECTPETVSILTQHGHLEALCALTAIFLRQQQQQQQHKGLSQTEDIESLPGLRALHIMFKIGALAEGFRAVAAAIVALAMPSHGSVHPSQVVPVNYTDGDTLDTSDKDETETLPSLSTVLADHEDPLNLGKIDNHQHFTWDRRSLKLHGLPHGNRFAVEAVSVGTKLWVYTMARSKERQKAFQTFVQILPTGKLFIGGKEQQVSVMSVVQGSTLALDAAFHISGDRRACVFRVQAMPRDCALASSEPLTLAFGAKSIQERDLWMHGISVIVVRCSVDAQLQSSTITAGKLNTQPDSIESLQPSYQGVCDGSGVPCGHGVAVNADGTKHVGNWVDGMLSGLGALLLPSGDKYMGEWRGGLANGLGVHLAKGGLRYEGEWLSDARHGYGVDSSATQGLLFCGTYIDGERDGDGLLVENSVARHCVYESGVLISVTDTFITDAKQRSILQEVQRAAREAASKAKRMAIETSRLVMDIEEGHKHAARLSAPALPSVLARAQ